LGTYFTDSPMHVRASQGSGTSGELLGTRIQPSHEEQAVFEFFANPLLPEK